MPKSQSENEAASQPNPKSPTTKPNPNIREEMASLSARIERLENANDTNVSVFADSIKMLESMQQVSFRILQDVFNGRVRVADVEADDNGIPRATVDVRGYLREFFEEQTIKEEAVPVAPEESPILPASDESPTIFGGDLQ